MCSFKCQSPQVSLVRQVTQSLCNFSQPYDAKMDEKERENKVFTGWPNRLDDGTLRVHMHGGFVIIVASAMMQSPLLA